MLSVAGRAARSPLDSPALQTLSPSIAARVRRPRTGGSPASAAAPMDMKEQVQSVPRGRPETPTPLPCGVLFELVPHSAGATLSWCHTQLCATRRWCVFCFERVHNAESESRAKEQVAPVAKMDLKALFKPKEPTYCPVWL